jgi:hypothetical protein
MLVRVIAAFVAMTGAADWAGAEQSVALKDASACIKMNRGPERKGDKEQKRYMENSCPQPIEVALCLGSNGKPIDKCGESKKYYRWSFVLEPHKKKFNKFQIPEGGPVFYSACYGKWGSIAEVDAEGRLTCNPPPPPPIDIQTELSCGDKVVKFRLKVLFNRKGAKVVDVRTEDKRRTVFSAAKIARWPTETTSKSLEIPLPIVNSDGSTKVIPLTERRLLSAVCDLPGVDATGGGGLWGFPSAAREKLKERVHRRPGVCTPPKAKKGQDPGQLYIDHCFKKTKSAGPIRG